MGTSSIINIYSGYELDHILQCNVAKLRALGLVDPQAALLLLSACCARLSLMLLMRDATIDEACHMLCLACTTQPLGETQRSDRCCSAGAKCPIADWGSVAEPDLFLCRLHTTPPSMQGGTRGQLLMAVVDVLPDKLITSHCSAHHDSTITLDLDALRNLRSIKPRPMSLRQQNGRLRGIVKFSVNNTGMPLFCGIDVKSNLLSPARKVDICPGSFRGYILAWDKCQNKLLRE